MRRKDLADVEVLIGEPVPSRHDGVVDVFARIGNNLIQTVFISSTPEVNINT
jgi:hypothetical protein